MTEHVHFIEYYPRTMTNQGVPAKFANDSRVLDITSGMSFYCSAAFNDECHVYPDDSEEWSWGHQDQTFVGHDRCWISDWMEHGEALIPHGEDPEDYKVRRGLHPIKVTWEGDHITWDYADPEEATS